MKHLDLFSGMGGFSLAADRVWKDVEHTFVEIDPFCQAVLKKHWPHATIYGDIKTFSADTERERYAGSESEAGQVARRDRGPFLLTGGFPCQPFSGAGKRQGTEDARYLWPEMLRVIREFRPRWVVGENVRGLLSIEGGLVFEHVCADLETIGYEVQPFVIPACAVGAPHRRDRIWIVAYDKSFRLQPSEKPRKMEGTQGKMGEKWSEPSSALEAENSDRERWSENWSEVATRLCTLDDGLPDGLVRPKGWRNAALKGAGNAIVPAIAEQIFRAIAKCN